MINKLALRTPPDSLVSAYLEEIAKAYRVDWTAEVKKENDDNDDDDDVGGGLKARVSTDESPQSV